HRGVGLRRDDAICLDCLRHRGFRAVSDAVLPANPDIPSSAGATVHVFPAEAVSCVCSARLPVRVARASAKPIHAYAAEFFVADPVAGADSARPDLSSACAAPGRAGPTLAGEGTRWFSVQVSVSTRQGRAYRQMRNRWSTARRHTGKTPGLLPRLHVV